MNLMLRMRSGITAFFLINLIVIPTCLALEVDIGANYMAGRLQGFNQTPQGGTTGSTTFHRPSFEELNIHQDTFLNLSAKLLVQNYALLFNYYHFTPQGQSILKEALITHGKFIPKGSLFEGSLNYHLYSLGFGKLFEINNAQLLSWLEINCLKYHYDFSAFPVSSARTYSVTGMNLGIKYRHDFSHTLFSDIQFSVPLFNANLTVFKAEFGLNKTFTLNHHVDFIPRLGVGLLQLNYKDNQAIPNHIRYTNSPYFSVGLISLLHI